ncbi:MAG: hypothetical protein AB7F91_16995 [Parvularculaceae bacterium]|nr:hypothetical protein [Parvularculaceae bacterium]
MKKELAASLLAALALAGCGSTKEKREANPGLCPNIVVLDDAARLVDFDGDEAASNVAWSAEIEDVNLSCRYFGEKPIDASARISIAFGKGPKATTNEHNFAYWIAVTRVNREVIEKREFIVPIKFGSEEAVERVSHEIEKIIIPRKDDTISGSNFEVVVGLVVTPEQAIFNRSGKSLKFPELNAAD